MRSREVGRTESDESGRLRGLGVQGNGCRFLSGHPNRGNRQQGEEGGNTIVHGNQDEIDKVLSWGAVGPTSADHNHFKLKDRDELISKAVSILIRRRAVGIFYNPSFYEVIGFFSPLMRTVTCRGYSEVII